MSATSFLSVIASATTLALGGEAAVAAPTPYGTLKKVARPTVDLVTVAFHGGMGMGHAALGHAIVGHGMVGHGMIAPRFSGPRIGHTMPFHAHNFHDHRHHRFFIVGVPYFYGYDYGYDYDYNYDSCWWSRHYHRWVCPEY